LPENFGTKLHGAFEEFGHLCVGIDPHSSILESLQYGDSIDGLKEFSFAVLNSAIGSVAAIKPQVAFFERFGSKGFEVLAEICSIAKEENLLIIADAKRGDIGTTMDGYFEAWFGAKSGLYCDALTVSPYLGFESLKNSYEKWSDQSKGVFTLAATSNPEGFATQLAITNGHSLASEIVSLSETENAGSDELGNFGVVVGATIDFSKFGLTNLNGKTPILAPGFGFQGAKLSDAKNIFGSSAGQVLYSVSRSITDGGIGKIRSRISSANEELNAALN